MAYVNTFMQHFGDRGSAATGQAASQGPGMGCRNDQTPLPRSPCPGPANDGDI